MSLLFGSDNQISTSLTNSIFFNPSINVGDGNKQEQRQTTDLTSTFTPKMDNSATASVGVGVAGGSGSGGAVAKGETTAIQPMKTKPAVSGVFTNGLTTENKILLALAGATVLGVYYMNNKQNGSKRITYKK